MSDREKLYELIDGFDVLSAPTGDFRHCFADYLISHGVTAQEWIPVTELPDVGVKVLTLDKWGHVRDRELYQFSDGLILFRPDGMLPGKDITHWRPMLQGPTEEK